MSLITIAIFSTEENKKDEYLSRTLESLERTVDFTKHRLILSVNAYTPVTQLIFRKHESIIEQIIWNNKNIGTAEAINRGWFTRKPNENAVKMDDDVIIHQAEWMDLMDALCWDDKWIGQVGLKRKDLIENPNHPDEFYRSKIYTNIVPFGNITGQQRVIVVEQCHHIMGTCVMHSANLLNELGYMWQPKLYGFDDSLMSLRSELAGFKNVFIPEIKIEHIDRGQTPFQNWKHKEAGFYFDNKVISKYTSEKHRVVKGQMISLYTNYVLEFEFAVRDIYYNPFE